MKTSVLAIGLDPAFANLAAFRGLTPELVHSYIDAQIQKVTQAGYVVEPCLIEGDETADQVIAGALQSKQFDCVVIGAGLRLPPEQFLLFERLINLVHSLAPAAKICFNTNPADTLEAVQRWVGPNDGLPASAVIDGGDDIGSSRN
jgi:hypothetical protein